MDAARHAQFVAYVIEAEKAISACDVRLQEVFDSIADSTEEEQAENRNDLEMRALDAKLGMAVARLKLWL